MNTRTLGADALLLLTAAIWGFGFVAQRSGMEYLGPFAFNGIRFPLGSLSLLPLILWRRKRKSGSPFAGVKQALNPSLVAGTCLFIAVTFQQMGIMFTTAGNAGFITGLYVVLTPLLGIFLGRKTRPATWIGTVFTLTGLYFISSAGLDRINPGDLLVAAGAVFWAFHVLLIDRFVSSSGKQKTDPIVLSSGQFAVCGILSLAAAFLVEPFLGRRLSTAAGVWAAPSGFLTEGLVDWLPFPDLLNALLSGTVPLNMISGALIPLLYGGLASVGIAYTLQAVAQQNAPPAHATIILCLEGSFAAFGGIILLHEPLGVWTIIGFALMLTGMLTSQLGQKTEKPAVESPVPK